LCGENKIPVRVIQIKLKKLPNRRERSGASCKRGISAKVKGEFTQQTKCLMKNCLKLHRLQIELWNEIFLKHLISVQNCPPKCAEEALSRIRFAS
jgi:hypothetical protein